MAILLATAFMLTLIIPSNAGAADAYSAPECLNPKRGTNEVPASIQMVIPGYSDGKIENYSCDNGIYRRVVTPSGHAAITITMAELDDSWRIWYSGLSSGDAPFTEQGFNEYLTVTDAGMTAKTYGTNWYFITVINGATIVDPESTGNHALVFTATSSEVTLQIARDESLDPPDSSSALPVFNGNEGAWDGVLIRTPLIKNTGLADWTKANTPIRDGYEFKGWATDAAGQHPVDANAKVSVGTHLYAQWEKAAGDPQKVDLDCSTGGRCELTVNYAGSTAKTREFQPGSGALAWAGSPVAGVRLDASGYAADGACSDTRCWYVSLDKEPNQQGSYQAQMPTTGAPEGLSAVGLIAVAVSLLGLTCAVSRRSRS